MEIEVLGLLSPKGTRYKLSPIWEMGTGTYFPPVGNKCLSPFSQIGESL